MDIKQPIFWHQGLFLQPQHFQLSDMYTRYMHRPIHDFGLPHFWGVGTLDISEPGLASNLADFSAAQLLFRDGTFVEYPGNAIFRSRSFAAAWTQGDKPFNIYVGLKKLNQHESNVTVVRTLDDVGDAATRYVTTSDPEEIRDLYGEGPSANYRGLTHLLRLFWESELDHAADYDTLPIARLERDGDVIKLAERFVPPCLSIASAPSLQRMVRDVRDEIAGRSRQLEEYKSPREMQKAEFDASYMSFLLALRSLNRYVPMLTHYVEARQVHPWVVYGTLRQLVGELSSFSERYNMLGESEKGGDGLPAYDHEDFGKCLSAVNTLVAQLLNEITIGPELMVRLEPQDGYLCADLPKSFFGARNRYYLVMRTEDDPDKVLRSFEAESKLSTRSQLPILTSRALPGVELIHMPVAPQGLPRRSYSLYFRVEPFSGQWEYIERENTVALYWPGAPSDIKVELVVLRR